jgi:hypothetical protein
VRYRNIEGIKKSLVLLARIGSDRQRKILNSQGRVEEETTENEKGEVTWRNVYTNGPAGRCKAKPT